MAPTTTTIAPAREEGNSGRKPYLGVRGKTFQQGGEAQGVKIMEVFPDSPAARAGLRSDRDPAPDYLRKVGGSTGHTIVGANGRAIRAAEDLERLLAHSSPGAVVKFLVNAAEGNSYEVIPVTLGVAPETLPVGEGTAEKRPTSPAVQGETAERRMEEKIFRAVNRVREKKGLSPLQDNPQLQRAARRHSEDMAARSFFGHLSPDGGDVVDRLRVEGIEEFAAVGENIFTGKNVVDPGQLVVEEWLKSPSHRQNLLNPRYTAGGVGIARGAKAKIYVTQVYLER
jgi:uncharacterized protein YkwD